MFPHLDLNLGKHRLKLTRQHIIRFFGSQIGAEDFSNSSGGAFLAQVKERLYAFFELHNGTFATPTGSLINVSHLRAGYCWSTRKYRNWCAQYTFFEGQKAEQTSSKKSTPRTLKGVDQQYPEGSCDSAVGLSGTF